MAQNIFNAVILAAGKGTRMKSPIPKVLHSLGGRSMIFHILKELRNAGLQSVWVVVGHGRDQLEAEIAKIREELKLSVTCVVQEEQLGTGHAVQMAFDKMPSSKLPLLVLNGDVPLLSVQSIHDFINSSMKAKLSVGAFRTENPTGYGRMVCRGSRLLKITEEREANPKEKKINLVNGGLYFGQASFFAKYLPKIKASKKTGELYLTDLVALGIKEKVITVEMKKEDLLGVNDLSELAMVERVWLNRRLVELQKSGVKIIDPSRVWISEDSIVAPGVVLEPGVMLLGKCRIDEGAILETGCRLENTKISKNARIKAYSYLTDSLVEEGAQVGPFAHLRPGSKIGAEAKVGNFVEIKKSSLGKGSKISHLSYLGDATVGQNVNIGCGFITCNYDGFNKHETKIGDGAFVGSDVQVIAPLEIGTNSYVASGSTLTKDVPTDALGIARSKQENKLGYAPRLKSRIKGSK